MQDFSIAEAIKRLSIRRPKEANGGNNGHNGNNGQASNSNCCQRRPPGLNMQQSKYASVQ